MLDSEAGTPAQQVAAVAAAMAAQSQSTEAHSQEHLTEDLWRREEENALRMQQQLFLLQRDQLKAELEKRHQDGEDVVWSLCDRLGSTQGVEKSSSRPDGEDEEAQRQKREDRERRRFRFGEDDVALPGASNKYWRVFGDKEQSLARDAWSSPWQWPSS